MAQQGPQQLVRVYDASINTDAFQQDATSLLGAGWMIASQTTPTPGQLVVVYTRVAQQPGITINNTVVANPAPQPAAPPRPRTRAASTRYTPATPQPIMMPQSYVPVPRDYGISHLSPAAAKLHKQPIAMLGIVVTAIILILLFVTSGAGVFSVPLLAIAVGLLVVDTRNAATLHGLLPWGRWFHNHPVLTTVVTFFLGGWAIEVIFGPVVYFVQCYQLAPKISAAEHARLEASIKQLEAELLPPLPADQNAGQTASGQPNPRQPHPRQTNPQ